MHAVEEAWRPLEVDLARRILNGNESLVAIKALDSGADTWDRLFAGNRDLGPHSADVSFYLEYLERHLLTRALDLARKPSYDKRKESVGATLNGTHRRLIEVVVSQKTAELATALREAINLAKGAVAADELIPLLGTIAIVYLRSFEHIFAKQLDQIPHLAALLYNDCQFLSMLLSHSFSVDERGAGYAQASEIKAIGTSIIQSLLTKQLVEIKEYCTPREFAVRFGPVDHDFMGSIERSLAQAVTRISQLVRVLSSILDPDLTFELAELLASPVLNWLWSGILSIKSLRQDAAVDLAKVSGKAVSFASMMVPPSDLRYYPFMSQLVRKLESLIRMTSMNLMQLSNAFRRNDFIDVLSLREFRSIILFLFPETAMKKAFLAEIDAEI